MDDAIEQGLDRLARQQDQLYQQGRYEQAIAVATRACQLSLRHLGEDHPLHARDLDNLAELYYEVGFYAEAESLYKEALEIRRKALGENHPDVAATLNNLAGLYAATHREAEAESLYHQALKIEQEAVGDEHPDVAGILNNLGLLQDELGDYLKAESLYKEALEIRQKVLGDEHPDVAGTLNNLAVRYHQMGDYAEAESLYRRALEIWRKALGEDPRVANVLSNLAGLCAASHREVEALALIQQAVAIDGRLTGQIFSISSETQRMDYLRTLQVRFATYLSLISRYFSQSDKAVRGALELVLRRKAIGAEALAVQRDAVLRGRYPQLQPKLRELSVLRTQIAQKVLAGSGPEGPEGHQQLIAEWTTLGLPQMNGRFPLTPPLSPPL